MSGGAQRHGFRSLMNGNRADEDRMDDHIMVVE